VFVTLLIFFDFYIQGPNCDQRCLDIFCTTYCTCDPSNCQKACNQSLTINNKQFDFLFNQTIIIQGNLNITGSTLNLYSNQMKIESNFSLSNSTLTLSSSNIIVNGCINVSNSNLSVYLSQYSTSIIILKSDSGCFSHTSLSVSYNQPQCFKANTQIDSSSITIIISPDPSCQYIYPSGVFIVIIVAASVFGLAIIFVVLVMTVPALREKIFKKKKNINLQISLCISKFFKNIWKESSSIRK